MYCQLIAPVLKNIRKKCLRGYTYFNSITLYFDTRSIAQVTCIYTIYVYNIYIYIYVCMYIYIYIYI